MLESLQKDYHRRINRSVAKRVRKELSDPSVLASLVRFGTVTDATGQPRVLFDGEDVATNRRYPYAASYTPTLNDRVMLMRGGSTWVVICKIV